jgi:UPF0755 protein
MAKKKNTAKPDKGKSIKKCGSGFAKKVWYAFLLILVMGAATSIYIAYNNIYVKNIVVKEDGKTYFYIKTGSSFLDVIKSLKEQHIVRNESVFEWLAKQKNYTNKVKPGRYALTSNMSNNDLINLLRSGEQEAVKLSFNNVRNKTEFIRKICTQLETDSTQLYEILTNDNALDSLGYDSENILAMFIPNTYDFYWNTTAKKFMNEMYVEHKKFWNKERLAQMKKLNITKVQTSIVASIVEKESNYKPERPTIASVYLNRLRKGMKLQADPTVIYAMGDFKIQRLLSKHLDFDNPYNTYRYAGLPPGPICLPSINALDAALNAPTTNYIYFCAKEDFSGSHNFASTLDAHNRNATKFQRALNKRKIFS